MLSYSMMLTRKVTNLEQNMFCISHNMIYPALKYVFRNLEVGVYTILFVNTRLKGEKGMKKEVI